MNSFESALNPTSCLFSQAAEIQPPDRIGIPNVEAYLQKQINIKPSIHANLANFQFSSKYFVHPRLQMVLP